MKNKTRKLSQFTIRSATHSEMHKAVALLKVAAQELKRMKVNQWNYWLDPPAERLEWLEEGFVNNQFYFVFNQNQLVAMYRLMEEDLKYWGPQEESAFYIHSLVVHPDFKGFNLGKQLLESIHDKAKVARKKYLRLDCDASTSALCSYYERLDFKKVGMVHMSHSDNALFQKEVS